MGALSAGAISGLVGRKVSKQKPLRAEPRPMDATPWFRIGKRKATPNVRPMDTNPSVPLPVDDAAAPKRKRGPLADAPDLKTLLGL